MTQINNRLYLGKPAYKIALSSNNNLIMSSEQLFHNKPNVVGFQYKKYKNSPPTCEFIYPNHFEKAYEKAPMILATNTRIQNEKTKSYIDSLLPNKDAPLAAIAAWNNFIADQHAYYYLLYPETWSKQGQRRGWSAPKTFLFTNHYEDDKINIGHNFHRVYVYSFKHDIYQNMVFKSLSRGATIIQGNLIKQWTEKNSKGNDESYFVITPCFDSEPSIIIGIFNEGKTPEDFHYEGTQLLWDAGSNRNKQSAWLVEPKEIPTANIP